jgi:iron complex outermembrane receptor protein
MALVLSVASVHAAGQPGDPQSLKQLSLEALGNIEITSVSKIPEELRRTAAAIYVITQDDIRRSGATTIPELLRLAPGLDVARIDNTHWSVGVRGFGDQFSKSVLLLIDGRSVYTPLFAGVWWSVQDTPLEDIERIEIIRGPGGTIWGANAVNGVINIVTKAAGDTQGGLVSASTGNVDRGIGTLRYGGRSRSVDYRFYGKGFSREPQAHTDGQDFDTWRMGQAGGRADWSRDRDTVTVQGDVYDGRVGQSVAVGQYAPPAQIVHYEPLEVSGGNLLARWQRQLGDASHLQLQAYYDRTNLLGPQIGETRDTFDVDFLHQMPLGARQRITWGGGARVSPSATTATVETLTLTPADQTSTILSAFAQDEITLVPEHLVATVGTKFERYTYTGLEVQPSVRLLWTPDERHSFWTSFTHAVRTPSRLEHDLVLTFFAARLNGLPTYVRVLGDPAFASERLRGFEAGYRSTITPSLYVDVAAFRNRHEGLETFGDTTVLVEAAPDPLHAVLAFPYANGADGTSEGVEVMPTWKPAAVWQLRGYYAYLKIDAHNVGTNTDEASVATYEGSSPRHQVQVQSMVDLPGGFEFDQTVRHVGALPARAVPAYTTADVRLGWHRGEQLRLSLTGQNLFDATHLEFGHDPGPAVAIRRAVVATFTWTLP